MTKHLNPSSFIPHLYQDLPPIGNKLPGKLGDIHGPHLSHDVDISPSVIPSFGSKLGLLLPDPAPDVAPNPEQLSSATTAPFGVSQQSKYQITYLFRSNFEYSDYNPIYQHCVYNFHLQIK